MMGGTFLARFQGQLLFAAVALVLALGTTITAAAMAWAWRESSTQWSKYQAYRDLQQNAGRADSLTAVNEKLGGDLESLKAALPAHNEASHVVNLLVDEARKQNLEVSGITALDAIPFPGYVELPFEVSFAGEFLPLVRYFHALETHGMAIQLRRVQVSNKVMNKPRITARAELSILLPAIGDNR
jgi:Tfp pilus assembly protein PilO